MFLFATGMALCQGADTQSQRTSQSDTKLLRIRPVFIEFSMRSLPAINYFPGTDVTSPESFNNNKLYSIKLNLPLLLTKKLNVIGQFRYKNEQLHFGSSGIPNVNELHFDNVGMSLLFKYDLNQSYFLAGHFGGFLNADKLTFENYSSILDYNSSFLVGKNTDRGSVGVGAIFGNSMGRFRFYPLFLLEHQFSSKWRLEMKLPKEILFRRVLKPDSFYLLGGVEANGSSYFISQNILPDVTEVEYRRAAIELKLGVEKEIIDFLWFGVDIGLTQPLFSALVESGEPTRNKLFDFDHSFTPYGAISLYIVPPKSLFNKMR